MKSSSLRWKEDLHQQYNWSCTSSTEIWVKAHDTDFRSIMLKNDQLILGILKINFHQKFPKTFVFLLIKNLISCDV